MSGPPRSLKVQGGQCVGVVAENGPEFKILLDLLVALWLSCSAAPESGRRPTRLEGRGPQDLELRPVEG